MIRGEATGNTHWLHRGFDSTDVRWAAAETGEGVLVGYLLVLAGESALLIHSGEHGANGIGPGTCAIHRKRAKDVRVDHRQRDYLVEG